MKNYIMSNEIKIYEGIIWTSLFCVGFYISYIGMDGLENSIYNFVENIIN